ACYSALIPYTTLFRSTFSTTVGQTYEVQFNVGRHGPGSGTMSLHAEVTASGGAVLGSLNAVAPSSAGYGSAQTLTFTATTSSSRSAEQTSALQSPCKV